MKKTIFIFLILFTNIAFAQVSPTGVIEYFYSLGACNTGATTDNNCTKGATNCEGLRPGYTNEFYCTGAGIGRVYRTQCPITYQGKPFMGLKSEISSSTDVRCKYGVCPAGMKFNEPKDGTCGCIDPKMTPVLEGSSWVCKIADVEAAVPDCPDTQFYDSNLQVCKPAFVVDEHECGDETYATAIQGGFQCSDEQPDNTSCQVNIAVMPSGTQTVYSCVKTSSNNSSSSQSNTNTSAPSSSGSNTSSGGSGGDSGGSGGSSASAGSAASSGSASSASPADIAFQNCELNFGAGNCQITNGTPCPNTYKQNGVTYCVTGGGSGSGSSSSSGSGGGSNGSSGSNSSQDGECDTTASNYLECVTPEGDPMPDHTTTGSGLNSIEAINDDFRQRLNNAQIASGLNKIKNVVSLSAPSCPQFSFELMGQNISTITHCSLWEIIGALLSPIMIAIWSIVAFRIFASA